MVLTTQLGRPTSDKLRMKKPTKKEWAETLVRIEAHAKNVQRALPVSERRTHRARVPGHPYLMAQFIEDDGLVTFDLLFMGDLLRSEIVGCPLGGS